jgi:hypothetical protein
MIEDVRVVSCYEAGRDGFWIHRYLESQGIENLVVDSASLEVSRRKRRAKTDRIDDMQRLSDQINSLNINEINVKGGANFGLRATFLVTKRRF